MTGEGIVVSVSDKTATVRIERKSACSGECSSCGLCENPVFDVEAENVAGAREGDCVKLYMPSARVYMSAFLVYMLPLLAVFAVMGICTALSLKAFVTAVCTVPVPVLWLVIIKAYNKRANLKSKIIEIVK